VSVKQLDEIEIRLTRLEKQGYQDLISLLEIMSSATFFGEMKKTNCEYAKEHQCGFYFLRKEAKNRLPIVTDCRIKNCKEKSAHCHLELSNLTCTLCPIMGHNLKSEGTKPCREE
jgi:hypothetical protein